MKWADAKTYAWLYSVTLTGEYRRELLRFIEDGNPQLARLVRAEIGKMKLKPVTDIKDGNQPLGPHEDRDRDSDSAEELSNDAAVETRRRYEAWRLRVAGKRRAGQELAQVDVQSWEKAQRPENGWWLESVED